MSGLPGSGKSTLARVIAPLLGVAAIDKDDFLEQLLDAQPAVEAPFGASVREMLSRQADILMREHAEASGRGAVLVSFWRRVELSASSGSAAPH